MFSSPLLDVPPLDLVKSWVSNTELSNQISNQHPPIDECLVPPLHIDNHCQGAALAQHTTLLLYPYVIPNNDMVLGFP